MEDIFSIHIKSDDIKNKKYKIVGCGTDGIVLRYNKDYLLKVYRNKLRLILDPNILSYDTKTYDKRININNSLSSIIYYQHSKSLDEDIRLHSKEALKRAINRQDKISLTKLPIGALYLDNQFSGSIIKASSGIQIHKLTGIPLSYKRRLILSILKALKELLDNYIYHIDLSNSPHAKSIYKDEFNHLHSVGHSHVLVNPFTLKTNIIDLDGKSTIYMERFSEKYYRLSINGMLILLLEFLLEIDLEGQEIQEIDLDILDSILRDSQIDEEYIRKIEDETIDIHDLFQLTKTYKIKK